MEPNYPPIYAKTCAYMPVFSVVLRKVLHKKWEKLKKRLTFCSDKNIFIVATESEVIICRQEQVDQNQTKVKIL